MGGLVEHREVCPAVCILPCDQNPKFTDQLREVLKWREANSTLNIKKQKTNNNMFSHVVAKNLAKQGATNLFPSDFHC